MKIECRPKEGRREILTLWIDEEPWREIHTTIFGRRPRFENLDQFAPLEYKCAKNYALKRLSLKNQPSTELRKALLERLVSTETTQKIVDEMIQYGYINDHDWISSFIRVQKAKKMGPRAIEQKLRMKGIPVDQITYAMQEHDSSLSQKERIIDLLNTRYKNRNLSDYKEKQKVIASLVRKGYDLDDIFDSFTSAYTK